MTISINATTNAAVTKAICKLDPKKKKEVKTISMALLIPGNSFENDGRSNRTLTIFYTSFSNENIFLVPPSFCLLVFDKSKVAVDSVIKIYILQQLLNKEKNLANLSTFLFL